MPIDSASPSGFVGRIGAGPGRRRHPGHDTISKVSIKRQVIYLEGSDTFELRSESVQYAGVKRGSCRNVARIQRVQQRSLSRRSSG